MNDISNSNFLIFILGACALVCNEFSKGQRHDVCAERAVALGESVLNRTCYGMWSVHVGRLSDERTIQRCMRTYRNFLTTGFGASAPARSRDRSRGRFDRGQSGGRIRSNSRGRSHSREWDRPGPSRRRSPDRDYDNQHPSKRGRSSTRRW